MCAMKFTVICFPDNNNNRKLTEHVMHLDMFQRLHIDGVSSIFIGSMIRFMFGFLPSTIISSLFIYVLFEKGTKKNSTENMFELL